MEMTWTINDCGEKKVFTVTLTENSFKRVMDMLNVASEDTYIQLNDPRFNNGEVIFYKKEAILGWKCSEKAILKCLEVKE